MDLPQTVIVTYHRIEGLHAPENSGFHFGKTYAVVSIQGNPLSQDQFLAILSKKCIFEKKGKQSQIVTVHIKISILEVDADGEIMKFQILEPAQPQK